MSRVLAAMSGGVDSAVAAARMVDAGHEVVGVHLALAADPAATRAGSRGCCSAEDARDARRAADTLAIPFYVWDLADRFRAEVVEDFLASYAAGRTPNPCLRCNEKIKFAAVLDRALALGFDAVCTGHYARIRSGSDGRAQLHRAVDAAKDQSYVLGVLDDRQLAAARFPLGDTPKSEVRAEAARRGLAVAAKPDSHDICFIADGDTRGWLGARLPDSSGEVLDADGTVLGRHGGIHGFTVGQRRGLGLDRPAEDGRPRFVLSISPVTREVTVGPRSALAVSGVVGSSPRWCAPVPAAGTRCSAQVRAHSQPVPAVIRGVDATSLVVDFDVAVEGVAAGQAVVVYDGSRVLGSATVDTTRPAVATGPAAAAPGPTGPPAAPAALGVPTGALPAAHRGPVGAAR